MFVVLTNSVSILKEQVIDLFLRIVDTKDESSVNKDGAVHLIKQLKMSENLG